MTTVSFGPGVTPENIAHQVQFHLPDHAVTLEELDAELLALTLVFPDGTELRIQSEALEIEVFDGEGELKMRGWYRCNT